MLNKTSQASPAALCSPSEEVDITFTERRHRKRLTRHLSLETKNCTATCLDDRFKTCCGPDESDSSHSQKKKFRMGMS